MYMGVRSKDWDLLTEFHVCFWYEVGRLESGWVSNREIAEIYLSTLGEVFQEQILEQVLQTTTVAGDFVRGELPICWSVYLETGKDCNLAKTICGRFQF